MNTPEKLEAIAAAAEKICEGVNALADAWPEGEGVVKGVPYPFAHDVEQLQADVGAFCHAAQWQAENAWKVLKDRNACVRKCFVDNYGFEVGSEAYVKNHQGAMILVHGVDDLEKPTGFDFSDRVCVRLIVVDEEMPSQYFAVIDEALQCARTVMADLDVAREVILWCENKLPEAFEDAPVTHTEFLVAWDRTKSQPISTIAQCIIANRAPKEAEPLAEFCCPKCGSIQLTHFYPQTHCHEVYGVRNGEVMISGDSDSEDHPDQNIQHFNCGGCGHEWINNFVSVEVDFDGKGYQDEELARLQEKIAYWAERVKTEPEFSSFGVLANFAREAQDLKR